MTRRILHTILILTCFFTLLNSPSFADSKSIAQTKIRTRANEILSELYVKEPRARHQIKHAAGYAVFTNFGVKVIFAGGGGGKGIAINNTTMKETFMRMVEVQAGLGLGIKTFKLVWIFEEESSFDRFINSGWTIGAQATAAAQYKDSGGSLENAIDIAPGVWLYQLTGDGLALELTAKGTKYFKDGKLN